MNIQNFIRPSIKALKAYTSARNEFKGANREMVFLDANENPFDNGINRYPDPQQLELKQLLSNLKGVSTDNMLLGNGSDEILDLIIRMFCEPKKDSVVILPPTYGMYEVLANLNDLEIIKIELTKDFQPNVDDILSLSNANTKILFLCSPNNPTGNSIGQSKIEELLKNFNGIVVIDEAYIEFSQNESWSMRLEKFPNLIVSQTLSKAYGMAGIRLGICFASTEIISILNKIKYPYNINQLTIDKVINELNEKDAPLQQIQTIKNQRSFLIKELNSIDFVIKIFPTDANFILVEVDDAQKRYNQLIAKGIVVRNISSQPKCENCLRITIGTPEECKNLIAILKSL
ncbi:histidinol-phosphate transaminase [Subsaxibacter sp. CAU 1640]|uniref:histidinol-phosphate transaminase n=1 Tax=Subsaxibacter sp. CAU 1640 TaxID=2933271 RepID=UPI0020059C12|nr:histidinol-phosphate transaminase [Subsaxibacter sp. CAU 1640]MCK7591006.1 histidinol-phosphate transaminase [Subsaxibacter sp. CAU 1640]